MSIYLKLVLTMAIWGGTFIAARVAVQSLNPPSAAFGRFAIATICLVFLTYRLEGGLPPLKRHQVPLVVILGLTGVLAYNIFFFLGLETTPASRASLIIATNPVFVALAASLLFREPLTRLKITGIGLSLLGAALIIAKGNLATLLSGTIGQGDLFLLGSVTSWVIYTLVGKRVMRELSPLVASTYACLVGTIALFGVALANGLEQQWQQATPAAWIGIAYLGILGTAAGFTWFYQGVQAIGSARAAIFINLVPVFAIALGVLVLGEPLTLPLLVGGGMVVAGVYLTNR